VKKAELVAAVAKKTGFTRKNVEKTVKAVIEEVVEQVASKEKVQLAGLGTFEARDRAAHNGRNPHTGEKLVIAAVTVPAFKPSKGFKSIVAEKNAGK